MKFLILNQLCAHTRNGARQIRGRGSFDLQSICRAVGILSLLLLTACGSEMEESSSSGSSSASSSSSSSSTSSSSSGFTGGDIVKGQSQWNTQCSRCHGQFNGPNSNGRSVLKANTAVRYDKPGGGTSGSNNKYSSLEDYIAAEMPSTSSQLCGGSCAKDVAEYIRSFTTDTAVASSCESRNPVAYGKRTFRLLNSREYQNSVEDLLDVKEDFGKQVANNDSQVGGFISMASRAINDQIADSYMANAEAIADWAANNNKPFSCNDITSCASQFVNETAYRGFRRPLTAQEAATYSSFFSKFGTSYGMKAALMTLLTSPQFLYRDESGVDIATALMMGYYDGAGSITTVEAEDYDTNSPALPFAVQNDGGRAVVVWPGTGGEHLQATDNAAGQLFYTIVATESSMTLFATVNLPDALNDSFHYKLEGKDNGWAQQNNTHTNGFEELQISSWNNLEVGKHYTLKIQRREDGSSLDSFRLTGGEFGIPAPVDASEYKNPVELADTDAYVLTPHQFASALAFMYTGTLPDLELLQAARRDALTTSEQISAQIERLMNTDRGQQHVGHFVGSWLQTDAVVDVDREDVPDFTPAVKLAMAEEVKANFRHIFYDDSVPFRDFYGADYTFVNKDLADFYGAQGSFDDNFIKATIPGRGGVITSGAFMTVNAHFNRTAPILRSVDIRELMLCHHIDQPNAALDGDRDEAQRLVEEYERQHGGVDSRSFFELYTKDPACEGCHKRIINPLFGVEDFDKVGRIRPTSGAGWALETLENGNQLEVDLSGTLYGVESAEDDKQIDFVGAKDLSNKLADTDVIQLCLVKKGFRFITGLPSSHSDFDKFEPESLSQEQEHDFACAVSDMSQALEASNESPREMFKKLGSLQLLRFRK